MISICIGVQAGQYEYRRVCVQLSHRDTLRRSTLSHEGMYYPATLYASERATFDILVSFSFSTYLLIRH